MLLEEALFWELKSEGRFETTAAAGALAGAPAGPSIRVPFAFGLDLREDV